MCPNLFLELVTKKIIENLPVCALAAPREATRTRMIGCIILCEKSKYAKTLISIALYSRSIRISRDGGLCRHNILSMNQGLERSWTMSSGRVLTLCTDNTELKPVHGQNLVRYNTLRPVS